MEQKVTRPAWIEGMQEWQKENSEQRAVLCIAVDKDSSTNALFGYSLPIVAAIVAVINKNSDYKNILKTAMEVDENLTTRIAFTSMLAEFYKEHGIATEEADKTDDSSIKKSLKDLFSKLAEKL